VLSGEVSCASSIGLPGRTMGVLILKDFGSQRKKEITCNTILNISLEILQTRLDKVRCTLLWVTLLGQGVGLGDPQRSLPTPTFL